MTLTAGTCLRSFDVTVGSAADSVDGLVAALLVVGSAADSVDGLVVVGSTTNKYLLSLIL